MSLQTKLICSAASAIHAAIITHKPDIEPLDQAIGDGDHYINVLRGAEVIDSMADELSSLGADEALNKIAMKLLSTVGGAAGPLYASFFMGMAKTTKHNGGNSHLDIAVAFAAGVQELIKRGKGKIGEKTMLDVLLPAAYTFIFSAIENKTTAEIRDDINAAADKGLESTRDLVATRGRAAGLGERSIGHLDAGAKSCQVMIKAVCDLALKIK
jgi:dihydroxyacetone kinase-like protein|tara:strand:+ start:676 stop:1314 length:639 start_codon:yes stop_codon:yes gene_type:complete